MQEVILFYLFNTFVSPLFPAVNLAAVKDTQSTLIINFLFFHISNICCVVHSLHNVI